MSEANSPMFRLGQEHGDMDAMRISLCPPSPPAGPQPPNPDYPYMYLSGYHSTFDGASPHICTDKCMEGTRS